MLRQWAAHCKEQSPAAVLALRVRFNYGEVATLANRMLRIHETCMVDLRSPIVHHVLNPLFILLLICVYATETQGHME